MAHFGTLADLQRALALILQTENPFEKADAVADCAGAWQRSKGVALPDAMADKSWPPPATRARPPLAAPGDMPRRGLGSVHGRVALLHAVAHIELNAIDLAVDMAGRFATAFPENERRAFLDDWLSVAEDEARHFRMVTDRLGALGAAYGDLPAHDGLWQAADRTRHDVLARLAIAPLVLEARGLDVTPGMIEKLQRNGDTESADLLRVIYREEVGHVAIGARWFSAVCRARGINPAQAFAELVQDHFPGGLKQPFNHEARQRSGFPAAWYERAVGGSPAS